MGRYVHSASICNTLALLMSQGTVVEFLQRMSLLMKLQNCWTKGHSDIKLHCASHGDSHDDMCQLSLEELASELQSVGKDMTGSICSSEGDPEVTQKQGRARSDKNDASLSPDADGAQNDSLEMPPPPMKFCRRRGRRTVGVNSRASAGAVKRRPGRSKKPKSAASQHVCPECGRVFRHRQLLVTHLVTHSGERPFACRFPGCEKRFGQSSTRNYHERIHSDVRPYVCSQCGLGFKLAPVLRIHAARMHGTGEAAHSCDRCGRQFKLAGALRAHVRTVHSDARPHACDACPKQFKSRQQLVRHTRDMHSADKPLHCPVCDRAFTQACNMRTHMRTHTGEKPFICDVCGVRFAHSGSLKGHRSTHHKLVQHVAKREAEPANRTTFDAAVSRV